MLWKILRQVQLYGNKVIIKKKDVVILQSYVLDIISNILKRKGEL